MWSMWDFMCLVIYRCALAFGGGIKVQNSVLPIVFYVPWVQVFFFMVILRSKVWNELIQIFRESKNSETYNTKIQIQLDKIHFFNRWNSIFGFVLVFHLSWNESINYIIELHQFFDNCITLIGTLIYPMFSLLKIRMQSKEKLEKMQN